MKPGQTFTYRLRAKSNSAGVWPYHDHSLSMHDSIPGGMYGALTILGRREPRPDREFVTVFAPMRDFQTINGRAFLGNTPIYRARVGDRVQWDVVALGDEHHTFHVHGHRWRTPAGTPEDTRTIGPAESFRVTWRSARPARSEFVCTIHDGMTGELTVHSLLLRGPERAVPRGTPVALRVRAREGVTEVTIEEDTGLGFRAVATARPVPKGEGDGALVATVVPPAGASYRAVAGELVSSPLRVEVSDEAAVALRASARRGGALVGVRAPGAPPGTRVVLQLRLRERFGWWPVARARLEPRCP